MEKIRPKSSATPPSLTLNQEEADIKDVGKRKNPDQILTDNELSKRTKIVNSRLAASSPDMSARRFSERALRRTTSTSVGDLLKHLNGRQILDLLHDRNPKAFKEIYHCSQNAFESDIPYVLSEKQTSGTIDFRDGATTMHYFLEKKSSGEAVPGWNPTAWEKSLNDFKFFAFLGPLEHPHCLGTIEDMKNAGFSLPFMRYLVTIANTPENTLRTEARIVYDTLIKGGYFGKMESNFGKSLFKTTSKKEIVACRATVLTLAVATPGNPVVKLLLEQGCDPNISSDQDIHFSPITIAIKNGNKANVELLYKHGADPLIDREYLEDGLILTANNTPLARWAFEQAGVSLPSDLL